MLSNALGNNVQLNGPLVNKTRTASLRWRPVDKNVEATPTKLTAGKSACLAKTHRLQVLLPSVLSKNSASVLPPLNTCSSERECLWCSPCQNYPYFNYYTSTAEFFCIKDIFRTAIFLVDYDESALIKVVHNWIEHSVDHRGSSHMNNSGDLIYVAVRGGICIECYNQQWIGSVAHTCHCTFGYLYGCTSSEGLLRHYVVEVFARNLLIVRRGTIQHLDQLLLAHRLAQLLRHSFDIVYVDEAGTIVIKQVEYFVNAVLS
jgi:hypothetical protein